MDKYEIEAMGGALVFMTACVIWIAITATGLYYILKWIGCE